MDLGLGKEVDGVDRAAGGQVADHDLGRQLFDLGEQLQLLPLDQVGQAQGVVVGSGEIIKVLDPGGHDQLGQFGPFKNEIGQVWFGGRKPKNSLKIGLRPGPGRPGWF